MKNVVEMNIVRIEQLLSYYDFISNFKLPPFRFRLKGYKQNLLLFDVIDIEICYLKELKQRHN